MKPTAIHDQVIMLEYSEQERSQGRILIPDTGGERSTAYEVVDVGPGKYSQLSGQRIPMETNVGDIVIVPKAVVYTIKWDGVDYFITKDPEIQSIIK